MVPMQNIHPLTDFKRRTSEFRTRLKHTGLPEVLTVDGRADLVVQSAEAYQRLLDAVEKAQAIEGIRRGLAAVSRGEGRPVGEFDAGMRRKHRIPRKS